MDDICTICLCKDRKLSSIEETDLYQNYLQILYEISVYDLSSSPLCVRICWECCAMLRKIQRFKAQVKQSYWQLVLHVNQNTRSHVLKESISRPSRLQIHHVINMSYPLIEIKNEFDIDTINGTTLPIDNLKSESIDNEPHEEPQTFVNNLSIDNGSYPEDFINNLCIDNEMHREPETFVNNLEVGKPRTKKKNKLSKRKPSKDTLKKKLKVKKKRKSISEDTISDQVSNGFSDIESTLDLHVAKETETAAKVIENDKQTAFSCKQCGKSFGDEIQLSKHTDEEHTKMKEKKNGELIKTKRKPKQEVLSEKPECVECGKVFSSRKTYRYHLEVLHKGHNRYPCPRCGKVYQWKSNLGRHMRSHTARDSGELYCETCDKRFASVATFRQHLQVSRRHVSESEFTFMCNECGKKFVNKTRLRDHIDWEHLKKIKFKCQLCNKAFKCHTSLYVHLQNVHRDKEKKDNLCHVCGKSYQNAAKLKYHIVAMHTGETPYQCQRCSAAFGWYSSLYRHVREVHYKMRQRMESKSTKKTKKQSDQLAPLLPPDMALDSLQQPGPAR